MMERIDQYDTMCFACGKRNPIGLKLEFYEENNQYITVFIPGEEHQGFPGIMHGGITAAVLDEVCARYIYAQGRLAFTAALNIRYRKSIPIGKPVKFVSRIIRQRGRMYEVEGQAVLRDGTVAADAMAKVMEAKNQEGTKTK